MAGPRRFYLAREGWPALLVCLALVAAAGFLASLVVLQLAVVLLLIVAFLIRNPDRRIPSAPLAMLAPLGGRVVSVDRIDDPWLQRQAIRIRIRHLPWNVHALHSPVEGKVMHRWGRGHLLGAYSRFHAYHIQTDEGDDVVMAFAVGKWTRYVGVSLASGERVGQGQRCGYYYLAGTLDLVVPLSVNVLCSRATRVQSVTSELAEFVRSSDDGMTESAPQPATE